MVEFFSHLFYSAFFLLLVSVACHLAAPTFWWGSLVSILVNPVVLLAVSWALGPEAGSGLPMGVSEAILTTLLVFPVTYIVGSGIHRLRYVRKFERGAL